MAERIVRAAVYCRMSTDDQEDSIDRQLSTCLPYGERKGYLLRDELVYTDEGIAGDEFEKRAGFQRLLTDAKVGRFDVILCDEISRLSRQKFTEFMAKVAYPLEEAGVTVDSVAEGTLGWEEVADLLKLTIYQTNASGESKKLSYRVLSGQANIARQGRLLGGVRPYGCKAEYETVTIPGRAPKLVPVRLVPDGHKAEVVQWMFERYAAGQESLRAIAIELDARHAPPPGRNNRRRGRVAEDPIWTPQAVVAILRNPCYVGCLAWNQVRRGKYYRLTAGAPTKTTRPAGKRANGRDDWVLVENAHTPLVSREVFDRVQERLDQNRGGRHRAARRGYLLGGLVVCGHCGRPLQGEVRAGHMTYRCQGYGRAGQRVCGFGRVRQDAVINMLLRVLQRQFLNPQQLKRLRAEIARQENAEEQPDRVAALQAAVADLTTKIGRGRQNLAILPADMIAGVVATVRGWEQERDGLQAQIDGAGQKAKSRDFDAVVAAAEGMLWKLKEAAAAADPVLLGAVLRKMVAKVEFCWDRRPYGQRTRYILSGGVIHLRPEGLTLGVDCGAPSTSTRICQTGPFLC